MTRLTTIATALIALMATSACDTKTAATGSLQTAAIHWDEVASADSVAHAPHNANLIFMR